jgi:hypothetical protein
MDFIGDKPAHDVIYQRDRKIRIFLWFIKYLHQEDHSLSIPYNLLYLIDLIDIPVIHGTSKYD